MDDLRHNAADRSAILGDLQRVRQLIQLGAELDLVDTCERRTALVCACLEGHEHVVKVLLDGKYKGKGANIELRDCDGWTPLRCLRNRGRKAVVRLLLSRSANTADGRDGEEEEEEDDDDDDDDDEEEEGE